MALSDFVFQYLTAARTHVQPNNQTPKFSKSRSLPRASIPRLALRLFACRKTRGWSVFAHALERKTRGREARTSTGADDISTRAVDETTRTLRWSLSGSSPTRTRERPTNPRTHEPTIHSSPAQSSQRTHEPMIQPSPAQHSTAQPPSQPPRGSNSFIKSIHG